MSVKPLGRGTSLSKTHDMPKKARTAREQPSLGPTPSVNAPVTGGMAWKAQLHAVIQHIEGFDKRFGDGTHITEFREGHGRQPCGYIQVRCV